MVMKGLSGSLLRREREGNILRSGQVCEKGYG